MADPREFAEGSAGVEPSVDGSSPGRPSSPPPQDELRAIAEWITAFTKAIRGARVYAENNEMYQKFVDRAFDGLSGLLASLEELDLGIREDRILFAGEVVHHDSDRQEGLPFTLYRNAFRRLTLERGVSRGELVALIGAINADYGAFDPTGDDLVSVLWRLRLPHVRYVTIDALGLDRRRGPSELGDHEVDQIQADIEGIVAAIYRNGAPDDDIVKGVSLGLDDLEALKELRREPEEDLDLLEHATERAIADIPRGQLRAVKSLIEGDDREALTRRMIDILIRVLFREESGAASGATIELLQQLYDSLLLAQRYADARELVERLRATIDDADDMREMHIAQHILRLFASDARILPVLDAFNDGYRTVPISELVGFLRALGAEVAPVILAGLGSLDSAAHRKLICDLLVELGVPSVQLLEERSADAKWFVVRDILELARHHPPERITRLVKDALQHEHPKVRAQAVRVLRDYGPGMADELVGARLRDEDLEVRMVAARVAASRRSKAVLPVFEAILKEDDLPDREPRELKLLLGAYATVGQGSAVRVLGGLLHPSFFARLKSVDLQLAAASALGLVPSDNARAHLTKGARSLNPKIREACKRALSQTRRTVDLDDSSAPRPPVSGPDMASAGELDAGRGEEARLANADSTDVVFTVGSAVAGANAASARSRTADVHPVLRSGPAVPTVDVPHAATERMPDNLPPAPHEDALGAFEAAYRAARAAEDVRPPDPEAPSSDVDLIPEVFEYLGMEPPSSATSAEPEVLDSSALAPVRDETEVEADASEPSPLTPNGSEPLDADSFSGLTPAPRSTAPDEDERSAPARVDLAADLWLDEPGRGGPSS